MKTCEEYVLNELANIKKELAELKQKHAELEYEHNVALVEYKKLIDLVVKGTENFRLEDDGTYIRVYFDKNFVTLERKEDLKSIESLVNLVLHGQAIVRREDENE